MTLIIMRNIEADIKKQLVPQLAAFLIFSAFGTVSLFAQEDIPESTYVDLTVVTYNIHHGEGVDDLYSAIRIARTLEQYKPDLVALQAVDMGTNRTEGDLQINIIANHLGMFYVFGKTIDYLGGEYGNAILSKYPIISTQNIDISPGITSERRGLLRATIDIGFRTLKFYSTQFGIMDEEQKYHSKRLGSVFKRLMNNEPIIFCGDLNAEPYSVQLTPLMNQLMDIGTRFRNVTNTYPTPLMSRRIDYILINNQVEPFYYSVPVDTLSTVASNHLPVVAKVRITP